MRDAPQSGPNKWLPVQLATCNTHNMQLPALPSANFNDSNEDIETGEQGQRGGAATFLATFATIREQ